MEGYVRLWRKIRSHEFWKEERAFSQFEAWIDLVMLANGVDKTVAFRGEIINLKRGQFITSDYQLAERWGWSRTKVRKYLEKNYRLDQLKNYRKNYRYSILTIVNYDTYNPLPGEKNLPKKLGKNLQTSPNESSSKKKKEEILKNKKEKEKKPKTYDDMLEIWKANGIKCFDIYQKKFLNITTDDLMGWSDAFPALDIEQELKVMKAWLMNNTSRAKSMRDWPRFIHGWLSRSGSNSRSSAGYKPQKKSAMDLTKELIKKEKEMEW